MYQLFNIRGNGTIALLMTIPVTAEFGWWLPDFDDRVEVLAPTALGEEHRHRHAFLIFINFPECHSENMGLTGMGTSEPLATGQFQVCGLSKADPTAV